MQVVRNINLGRLSPYTVHRMLRARGAQRLPTIDFIHYSCYVVNTLSSQGKYIMEKEQTYTFRLSAELKKAFNEAAAHLDVPGSHLIREYMKHVVKNEAQRKLPLGKK